MTFSLETKSCYLWPLKPDDFNSFKVLQSNAQVTRYLGGPRSQIQITQRFNYFLDHQLKFGFSIWRVEQKNVDKFIGLAGFIHARMDDTSEEIELAYALVPSKWGMGLTTELVNNLLHWSEINLDGKKIIASVDKSNLVSRKILKKSGFKVIEELEKDEVWMAHRNP